MSRTARPEALLFGALTSMFAALATLSTGQAVSAQDTNQTGGGTIAHESAIAASPSANAVGNSEITPLGREVGTRSEYRWERSTAPAPAAPPSSVESRHDSGAFPPQPAFSVSTAPNTNEIARGAGENRVRRQGSEYNRHRAWRHGSRHQVCRRIRHDHHRVRACARRRR